MDTIKEKELYDFCNSRWEYYIAKDGGYYSSKHDEIVFRETSEKFGVTPEEAYEIFQRVGKPIADEEVSKMTPREIRDTAIKIIIDNKENPFNK